MKLERLRRRKTDNENDSSGVPEPPNDEQCSYSTSRARPDSAWAMGPCQIPLYRDLRTLSTTRKTVHLCRDLADKSTTKESRRTCRRPKRSMGLVWFVCLETTRLDSTRDKVQPDPSTGIWTNPERMQWTLLETRVSNKV